jgi:hypothetical protein
MPVSVPEPSGPPTLLTDEVNIAETTQPPYSNDAGHRTPRYCIHFSQGRCRFGDECRFVHDPAALSSSSPLPSPPSRGSSGTNTPRSPNRHPGNNGAFPRHRDGNINNNHLNHHQRGRFMNSVMPGPPMQMPVLLNDLVPPVGTVLTSPPAPILVNLPPHLPVFSIDVECVATGIQHNARSVAQVALVDQWGRSLFNVYIKQDRPIASYLTELTGITKEMLDEGMPLGN